MAAEAQRIRTKEITVLDPAASSSFQPYIVVLGLMLYDVLLFALELH